MTSYSKFHLKKFETKKFFGTVKKTNNIFYYLKNGKKIMDTTSGWTSHATLGFNNPDILRAIKIQMKKFFHVDYNVWHNPQIDQLSEILSKNTGSNNYKIYFAGCSGSESLEAAFKLSYQAHYNSGFSKKKIILSRSQSFHGATLQALQASELPILDIFQNNNNRSNVKVHQHNYFAICKFNIKSNSCECGKKPNICMGRLNDESQKKYLSRSVKYLEEAIRKFGAENINAFVGETQLGSLVGDVPAIKGYWKQISKICKQNKIHLILDEVYCGMGRSGKFYGFLWEKIKPDFICLGKNTTGGLIPLSFLLVKNNFEKQILKKGGRIRIGHTFQGYSLGVAAALQTAKIIEKKSFLKNVNINGKYMMECLRQELSKDEFFDNVRGRGLQFSLEHSTPDNTKFSDILTQIMFQKYNILINSKFHRTSFTPSLIISRKNINYILDKFFKSFKEAKEKF